MQSFQYVQTELPPTAATGAGMGLGRLNINPTLTSRRLYCFIGTNGSAAPVTGSLVFTSHGSPVGSLPIATGGTVATGGTGVASFANSSGADYTSSLTINLSSSSTYPGVPSGSYVLQPYEIDVTADAISINVDPTSGQNFRVFVACFSSE